MKRTKRSTVSLESGDFVHETRCFRHLKNMQKTRNYLISPVNFFSSVTASFRPRLVPALVLAGGLLSGLTSMAQVTPGTTSSGASPSSGATAPASGNTGLPANINPNSLPPAVRQQIQRAGGQAPGTNVNTGRTNAQTTNNGVGQDARTVDGIQQGANTPADTNGVQTQKDQIENGYEAARIRERNEIRRKLFGSALFSDPAMATTFQPNMSMATPRNYIVGPGDQLNIQLYGYSEADFTQKVSPEGYVYFRQSTGIGPVFISGLSIEQAKARIVSRLSSKFVGLKASSYGPQNTFLEVSLGSIRSIRVTVTGDAVRPGTYSLSSLSTVMNAIYQAGGPSELGSFRRVQLIRNNRVAATLDLYDYLLNGTQRNDLRLQDNDNIRFEPYIERVEIQGTVKRNNIFEMLPNESLDRLLFYAGGFAANAYKGRVKVQRLTDRERKVIDVTPTEFKTFEMQDGDLVTVEQLLDRFENQVTIEGAVFRPGQYSLDDNKTLKQLIASAENLKGDAFTGRVTIIRTREDLAIENITVNLANILTGADPDVALQREDQIIIPSRFDLAEQANVTVQGEVNKPAEMPFMANMTLDDALVRAGGLKESAAASQVEVVRRKKDVDPKSASAAVADVFRFNVNRDLTIANDQNRFVLEPYDQIIIRRSPNYLVQTYANVEGEVIQPGSYAILRKDQKISDMVQLAGGLTPQAYVEGATLVRQVRLSPDEISRQRQSIQELSDTDRKSVVQVQAPSAERPESIGINLKRIMDRPGSSEDILIQEGDILRIPKLLETVRIDGEVLLPNTVKYRPGQTFQDYIANAGGFTERSQRKRAFIVYANGSVDRTRRFMFFNVYPRVEPGSEVVVPRKTSNPLTPQQLLSTTAGTISSLLSVIGLVIALSATVNR
ncbi:protein involved in polysaccharide export with SLBB domain [Spirosoma oryzae]|uniref:Protein involved in polysaccharide export with SLBB domain n=1 Tax=Spirosoma oryzae TaxID=1469603 RepID=A0A2T0SUD9_9BACT|nr:protein involved in polysaccharide export with SLBB domain [Spirosoma oryzae]